MPRTFWILCGGMLVNRAGSFVLIFLSVYLTQSRGFSITTAGMIVALYGAGGMLASLAGGFFADHIGRRATMLGALTLGGLGIIGLGFARDLRVIAPMVFAVAFFGEAYRPAMQAAVSDLVPAENRVRAFGILYWAINVGFSIGAILGGALAQSSFLWLFIGDGVTTLLFAFLIARAVPETRPTPASHAAGSARRGVLHDLLAPYLDGPFGAFVLLAVLTMLVFLQHVSTLPIDMSAHGVQRTSLGAVLAINGIVIVLLQPFLAPYLQRWNRSYVLAVGASLIGLGFGLYALARTPVGYGVGVLIWTLGEICVLPISNAVVGDIAPSHMRGRYQGAYGLSFGFSGLCAPLVGTFVLQHFGGHTLWWSCLAVGVIAAVGHLLLAPALTRLREERIAQRATSG
ncbi:MAG: MFS transporter [Candidatus Eisenbacteria bacterium]|uniref:MFS transporter n=1 Tax=Eiseniibacteriota bacterium TaxID=2212470 RepID=A0A849SBS6_UNCEI|nr:MFS transporter [Candidatus Eisenbacteria bacterium]